jgi:hypothetical protein
MSNAPDGRSLAADEFDDDEIDWDDEPGDEVAAGDDDENISPLEQLAEEGDDVFDGPDNDDEDDEDA